MLYDSTDLDRLVLGLQIGRNDDTADVHIVFEGSLHLSFDSLNRNAVIYLVIFDAELDVKVF